MPEELTKWDWGHRVMPTQWGEMTYAEWCARESARINARTRPWEPRTMMLWEEEKCCIVRHARSTRRRRRA